MAISKDTKATMLGAAGERIVARELREDGHIVKESKNSFDNVKDMTVNGKNCEVKTQQEFMMKKAFTVPFNQSKKCTEVEHMVFVETPSRMNRYINLYYSHKKYRVNLSTYTHRSGSKVLILPKHDMKLIKTVTDEEDIAEMIQLTSTDYNWTKPKW